MFFIYGERQHWQQEGGGVSAGFECDLSRCFSGVYAAAAATAAAASAAAAAVYRPRHRLPYVSIYKYISLRSALYYFIVLFSWLARGVVVLSLAALFASSSFSVQPSAAQQQQQTAEAAAGCEA